MWYLKSPKNCKKAVDEEGFILEAGISRGGIQKIKFIYEKLSYMMQKDKALLYIADNLDLDYPNEVFTFSSSELEIIEQISKSNKYEYISFISMVADKVEYETSEISKKFDDVISSIEKISWTHYIPKQTIKSFFDSELVKLRNTEKKLINDKYLELSQKVYKDQKKLANEIFYSIDEEDKIGLINVYNYFLSFNLHQQRDLLSLFKNSENYKQIIKYYPLFNEDIKILCNNVNPYIEINKDLSCKWKKGIGAFADYFAFNTGNGKNTNWKILKNIFPQFKDKDLRKEVTCENQEFLDLMAKVPSFKIKYINKDINKRYECSVKEIISRIQNSKTNN